MRQGSPGRRFVGGLKWDALIGSEVDSSGYWPIPTTRTERSHEGPDLLPALLQTLNCIEKVRARSSCPYKDRLPPNVWHQLIRLEADSSLCWWVDRVRPAKLAWDYCIMIYKAKCVAGPSCDSCTASVTPERCERTAATQHRISSPTCPPCSSATGV